MPRKPANLVYGVNDNPPLGISVLLAFQHHFLHDRAASSPRQSFCARSEHPPDSSRASFPWRWLHGGLATILQALGKGPVGSGYLCTEGIDPTFISSSILAGTMGGTSLIFGMTRRFRPD